VVGGDDGRTPNTIEADVTKRLGCGTDVRTEWGATILVFITGVVIVVSSLAAYDRLRSIIQTLRTSAVTKIIAQAAEAEKVPEKPRAMS
jgi:hypothetical protein